MVAFDMVDSYLIAPTSVSMSLVASTLVPAFFAVRAAALAVPGREPLKKELVSDFKKSGRE